MAMKKETVKFIIQLIISILTAIMTTLLSLMMWGGKKGAGLFCNM